MRQRKRFDLLCSTSSIPILLKLTGIVILKGVRDGLGLVSGNLIVTDVTENAFASEIVVSANGLVFIFWEYLPYVLL